MLRHLFKPIVRTSRAGVRLYHVPHNVRPPTMDEVIVPCGDWKEAYDKAQKRYNLQLITGILMLVGTITLGRMNGTLWLNYLPPKKREESKSKESE